MNLELNFLTLNCLNKSINDLSDCEFYINDRGIISFKSIELNEIDEIFENNEIEDQFISELNNLILPVVIKLIKRYRKAILKKMKEIEKETIEMDFDCLKKKFETKKNHWGDTGK